MTTAAQQMVKAISDIACFDRVVVDHKRGTINGVSIKLLQHLQVDPAYKTTKEQWCEVMSDLEGALRDG